MDTNNLKYVIFDYNEIDKINFDQILESSIDSLRLDVDGIKTFVKWVGDEPECISNLISKSIIYNNIEMIEILNGTQWNSIVTITGTTESM